MGKLAFDHVWVAIIAGGAGTRLFPYSNPDRPKQFCILNDTKITFIQNVIRNFTNLGIKRNRIIVVITNDVQKAHADEQVIPKGVISQNIYQISPDLDYGGAMAEATKFIKNLDPDAVVINTPADQYIKTDKEFEKTIKNAVTTAFKGEPVIVGVKVNDLAVAMGCGHAIYEEIGEPCFPVLNFIEKPGEKEATRIMRAGNSACSTGISIWSIDTFFKAVSEGPAVKMATNDLMAKFPNLKIAVGDYEWHDCGTLKSLYDVSKKTPHHRNAGFGGGEIDRFECLDSLFLCDEGYRLHAAGCRGVAVIATTVDFKPIAAVIDINQSERVKKLAEDFARNKDLLVHDFSTLAHNNTVMFSNMSKETITCFACVDGYSIYSYRASDGMVDVFVSGKRTA